jgi:DNA polymerase-3 subunit epsilon
MCGNQRCPGAPAETMESFDWAVQAYRNGAVFTAFDIETTGLEPKQDRIVEFGAVKFDRRGPIARYSALINPGIPMPPGAGKVNHITDDMLAGEPPLAETLPDFLRFVKDTVIAAHNASFDCGFVNEALSRLYRPGGGDLLAGMDGPWSPPFPGLPNKIADTLLMARRFFPGRSRYNLQELAQELGLRAEAAHRALDDARLCMEIFVKMAGTA